MMDEIMLTLSAKKIQYVSDIVTTLGHGQTVIISNICHKVIRFTISENQINLESSHNIQYLSQGGSHNIRYPLYINYTYSLLRL